MTTGRKTAGYRTWRRAGCGRRLFHAECDGKPFVLEGGGIEVNGRGTLLTTEECYLHPQHPGPQPRI